MRKLVFAACGYTAALALAHYLLPEVWMLRAALICAFLSLAALLLRGKKRKVLLLVMLSAAFGFAWIWGYTALTVEPLRAYTDEVRTVSLRIASYPSVAADYSSVEAVCIDKDMPGGRCLIYDYDGGMAELQPGDLVQMELKMLSAEQRYNQTDDHYLAAGIHYRAYLKGTYEVTGHWKHSWLYLPLTFARELKTAAISAFPKDVAPLMKALLTGDKSEYYEDDLLYTAMRSSGFSHIVAVSGMHVAFIISFLSLLTGRRRAAFLGIPIVIIFMAMVGFTPSVVRAGVMQVLLLVAPLLRRENDPPTSLAAALLLLLVWNPIAIGSMSLQFSFAAMSGLLLITPRIYQWLVFDEHGEARTKRGIWGSVARNISSAFSASVGAIVFTVPLSAFYFGFVPIFGILTNLLCLWAMSTAFLCGYAVCIVWLVWHPLGLILGWCVAWLPRYTVFVVKHIADVPYAVFVTRGNLGAWWLLFVYVLFITTYLMKGEVRYRPMIPLCACVATLAAVSIFSVKNLDGRFEVAAVDVGQGLSLMALTENGTVVIDCGSTGEPENAGDNTADYLLQSGRNSVDLLILTHFHADHANGVVRLMNRLDVKRVAVPTDCEKMSIMIA